MLYVSVCSRMSELNGRVSAWSSSQVAQWLQDEGFGQYVDLLCSQHRIDGVSLLALTEADLRDPPLSLTVLGHIKRLSVALRRLQRENKAELEELGLWPPDANSAGLSLGAPRAEWSCDGAERSGCNGGDHLCNGMELRLRNGSSLKCAPGAALCQTHSNGRFRQPMVGRLDPEVWKTVISSVYVFLVCGLTSFVMVIVHERVPDMRTYPPLPDIFLDRYEPTCLSCVFFNVNISESPHEDFNTCSASLSP